MIQGSLSLMQLFEADRRHQEALVKLSVNPSPAVENLVFEGGGSKGITYIGALEALEERNLLKSVKRVAGSSAGGIVTTLLAVGYSPEEIKQIITKEMDLKELMDERTTWDPKFLKVEGVPLGISSFVNLFKHRGVFKGDAFKAIAAELIEKKILIQMERVIRKREEKIIESLTANYRQQGLSQEQISSLTNHFIKEKVTQLCETYYISSPGSITFGQIQTLKRDYPEFEFKDLYLTGSKLSDNPSLKVFSHEQDSNMPIIDALRITMSFPFGFEPVYYQGSYYADGGITNNYPMGIFDKNEYLSHGLNDAGANPCTLGFLVDSNEEIENRWGLKPNEIKNNLELKNFVSNLLKTVHFRSDVIFDKYHTNTIQLFDSEIDTLDFNLTDAKVNQAILLGKDQTDSYLDQYEYQEDGLNENIYHKYYSCSTQQLKTFHRELLEGLHGCHEIKDQLGRINLKSYLDFCKSELEKHPQDLVEGQQEFFERSKEIQEQLSNSYVVREHLMKSLKSAEREERNLIRRMKHELSMRSDKMNQVSDVLQKLKKEYQLNVDKKQELDIALAETERSIEQDLKRLKKNEAMQDPSVYDFVCQIQMVKYIVDDDIEERTNKIEQRFHEHLDVVLEALEAMDEAVDDIRTSPTPFYQKTSESPERGNEPFDNPVSIYAQSIRELTRRLRTGLWSDYILTECKSDVIHNFNNMKVVDNETLGKHQSGYQVETFIKIPKYKRKKAGYSWYLESPPVEMNVLIPDLSYIHNSSKKIKEIVLVFHEPQSDDGSDSEKYSVMNKYCSNRHNDFDQVKNHFLKQLKWAVRKINENEPQPDTAKIHLTLSGAGLAGLDAQLMLNAVIKELNESMDSDLHFIHSVDLLLDNSPRVSSKTARDFELETQKLSKAPHKPRISIYQSRELQPSGSFLPQCYLGQVDLSAYADPNTVHVELETHDLISNKSNTFSNQSNSNALYEKLHQHHWMYDSSLYQPIQIIKNSFVQFGSWLLTKLIPTLFKVAEIAAHVLGVAATYPLRFVFRAGSTLFKKMRRHFKTKKVKDTKVWSSLLQRNEAKKAVVVQKRATEAFLQETELSLRMKREKRPPIENLVFGGGGVDSHAYVGVLREMDSIGSSSDIKRVLGSDIGAVISTLYALGYKPKDIEVLLNNELNFNHLKDEAFEWDPQLFKVGDHRIAMSSIVSLFKNKGLYKGDAFKQVMSTLIEDKLQDQIKMGLAIRLTVQERDLFLGFDEHLRERMIDQYLDTKVSKFLKKMNVPSLAEVTFEQIKQISNRFPELKIKDIYITGSCLDDKSLKVFSHEKTPDMRLIDALRITNAYPGVYYPVEYEGKVYVSGQLSDSYPIPFFDHPSYLSHGLNESNVNPCTLGFLVDTPENRAERWGVVDEQPKDVSLLTVAKKVVQGMNTQTERVHGKYQINSIQIDNKGIGDGFQNVTMKQKRELVDSGVHAFSEYFANYMGNGVRYDSRKDYSNYYHKFFQKPEQELIHIYKEQLDPLIHEANILLADLSQNIETRETRLNELEQVNWALDCHSLSDSFHQSCLSYFKIVEERSLLEDLNNTLTHEISDKKSLRDSYLGSLTPESQSELSQINREILDLQGKLNKNAIWLKHLNIKESQCFGNLQSFVPFLQHSDLNDLEEYTKLQTDSKNRLALQLRLKELHSETDVLFEALQAKHSKFSDPRKSPVFERQKGLIFSKRDSSSQPPVKDESTGVVFSQKKNRNQF